MKFKTTVKTIVSAAVVVAAAGALTACAGNGSVAATINGENIYEKDITAQIESIRESYGAEDDETWGSYLSMFGMSAEDLREEIINEKAQELLVEQAIEENNARATAEEVEAAVAQTKANFPTDEDWLTALQSAGYADEKEYEQAVSDSLSRQNLAAILDEPAVLESAQQFSGKTAKRSSHILFAAEDTELAQKVLGQINSGELDFAEAAQKYSTDTASAVDGGDVGWDIMTTFVSDYQEGLDELGQGEVSGLVKSDFGIHIIKCTEVVEIPETITSLDQLPAEIALYVKQLATSTILSDWAKTAMETAELVVNPMPENVSYNVPLEAEDNTLDVEAVDASAEDTAEEAPADAA